MLMVSISSVRHVGVNQIDPEKVFERSGQDESRKPMSALLRKFLPVLDRRKESFDHLSINEVTVELVQLRQPEVIAAVICILRSVRIAPQISEVLHQHKGPVALI